MQWLPRFQLLAIVETMPRSSSHVCMYVCMYMYVCTYVCMCVHVYVRMYVRMYVCVYRFIAASAACNMQLQCVVTARGPQA